MNAPDHAQLETLQPLEKSFMEAAWQAHERAMLTDQHASRIADALERIAKSLDRLDRLGIRTFNSGAD